MDEDSDITITTPGGGGGYEPEGTEDTGSSDDNPSNS